MASHESSDLAARADVLVCQGAVLLLRARRKAGVAGELAPDVDRLLTASSLELETDPRDHSRDDAPRRCAARRAHRAAVHDSRSAWRRRRGCAGRAPPAAPG